LGTDSLGEGEKGWFAADGKSIRGSIAEGESQGQHIVQIIAHEGGAVVAETFYEGDKESEVAVVRQLLSKGHVCSQGITMDALHCNPTTLKQVAEAQGAFIVGLKGNQPELFQEMERCRHILPVVRSKKEVEKGHGRIDTREYSAYNIDNQYFDLRWDAVNFQTLVTVQRTRFTIKTKKETKTNSIFLSNEPIENAFILFGSVRNHWGIEVNNHFRDVTLQEDKLKTKTKNICRVLALIRTLTLKILRLLNPPNFKAQLELYQDQPDTLLQDLRKLQFL
jgi:predicted transposase YbfD/YdcC